MELIFKLWRLQLLVRLGAFYNVNTDTYQCSALSMAWGARKVFCFGNRGYKLAGHA